MSYGLAWGFDRGIGATLPASPYGSPGTFVVGTAPPAGTVLITDTSGTSAITLQEDDDSPTIERGTQCTAQHKFTMSYQEAESLIILIGMGTIVQDSANNIWRVLTCSIQNDSKTKGNSAKLVTVSESVSFDTPPDEFQVNSVDLGIDIIKHPRYFPNLYPTADEFGTDVGKAKEAIIRAIQSYRDSPFFPTAKNVSGLLNGFVQNVQVSTLQNGTIVYTVPNVNYRPKFDFVADNTIQDLSAGISPPPVATADGDVNDPNIPVSLNNADYGSASVALALAAAQEIITKLWRMEDSPYVAGIEIKWSQYYFLPPLFNLGSYLEDPTFIIPDYFLQPDRALTELPPRGGDTFPVAGANNIFQYNAQINPQCFSGDGTSSGVTTLTALRKADEIQYERTWFKITSTWVLSAIGYFDPQLYGASERPSVPSDYTTFS